jgi:hypothetical protein
MRPVETPTGSKSVQRRFVVSAVRSNSSFCPSTTVNVYVWVEPGLVMSPLTGVLKARASTGCVEGQAVNVYDGTAPPLVASVIP